MGNSVIKLNGFDKTYLKYTDAIGLSKCLKAYAENCSGSSIFEIGVNEDKEYAYIALEMEPIFICSFLGNRVQYVFTDADNRKEFFFDSYEEAMEMDSKITLY